MFRTIKLTLALLLTLTVAGVASADDDGLLTVGSKAPSIDVEHWVQDGDGKFSPVKEFKSGKVYIVEFWATWCGPCIAAMPHISELQDKYADKGVQVISVSDEDLETVEGFLEKKVRGDSEKTYDDLTSNYCLTTDPDRSVYTSYMKAARQGGIPTAFIVGKDGYIEWIGHPMKIDEPIKKVVDGKWDRAEYLAKVKEEEKAKAAKAKAEEEVRALQGKIVQKLRDDDMDGAIELIDEAMEKGDDSLKSQLSRVKIQLLMRDGQNDKAMEALGKMIKTAKGPEKVGLRMMQFQMLQASDDMKMLTKEFDNIAKDVADNAEALNQISWAVVEAHDEGDDVSDGLVKSARKAAEMAVKIEPKNGAVLDTLAHLQYMEGDLDKAIETQKKAVEFIDPQQAGEVKEYLEQLMEEKKDN